MPRSKSKDVPTKHLCPNKLCLSSFTSKKGLADHFQYYSQCHATMYNTSAVESANNNHPDASLDDEALSDNTSFHDNVALLDNDNTGNEQLDDDNDHLLAATKRPAIHRTNDDFQPTKLLKLLNDANAPLDLYSNICKWASDACADGYDFNPPRATRESQINHLITTQKLEKCRPYTESLTFSEDNLTIQITKFDFESQFYSLISDEKLTGSLDKLDVNPEDPFTQYQSPDGRVGSFNSGSWYRNAWQNLCAPESNDMLCPIIFGCDETLVGSHLGRASVTPLVFTLSIFNEALRNRPCAWRPLGYIYDLNQHGKAMNTTDKKKIRKMKPEEKCARHHMILKVILKELVAIQQTGGIHNVDIQLGPMKKENVTVKVPVGMILGDMQGGDKHCGSVVGYSSNMARLCRQCNVSGEESGDPWVECQKMCMNKIKQYVLNNDVEQLKSISQNNVYCAWFDVDFGGCNRGVFSAAMPVEALHAIEGGICKDVLSILFNTDLKPAKCGLLDIIACDMCRWDKQYYLSSGSNKKMPRLLFKDGITCLKKIASVYNIGIMLAVYVISLTDDGKQFFEESFESTFTSRSYTTKRTLAKKKLSDMRYVFSMMLCYWSWLKKTTYWECGDTKARKTAEHAIKVMLHKLIQLWPRAEGNGWFKPKVHEQKHVPGDIERNGSPRNSYSGPVEHNHLDVKQQAKRTQMNRETLDGQIGNRASETYVIDYCYEHMLRENEREEINADDTYIGKSPKTSHGKLKLTKGLNGKMNYKFDWSKTTYYDKHFDNDALQCVADYFVTDFYHNTDTLSCLELTMFTCYRRHGVIFRAHPSYKNKRSWYDWVMLRFEKNERDVRHNKDYKATTYLDEVYFGDSEEIASSHHYAPCKLMGFVEMPDQSIKAVVMCCSYEHSKSGVISTYWKLEFVDKGLRHNYYALYDVDSFVRHVLMIPENAEECGFHEIWEKERWANEFL